MIIGFFTLRQQSRKERDKFTRLLAEFDDIRTVGPLITALESKDALTLSAIKPALTRLLPDLKPDEARLLDDRQRQCLYRMLEPANADGEDAPLLAAILIALGKMEDEAAIPYVTHLAQGKVYTSRGRQIQDQARQCRTLLQQCAERRQMSQTLLRAAQSSEPPGNILLRPASGVPATDPDQLLRASLSAENQ